MVDRAGGLTKASIGAGSFSFSVPSSKLPTRTIFDNDSLFLAYDIYLNFQ